jgi:hypothetical protein
MRQWIIGIMSSMLVPMMLAPMVVAPPEAVESASAELNKWPTIQVEEETVPAPIPDPAPDAEPTIKAPLFAAAVKELVDSQDKQETDGVGASSDIDSLKSLSQKILESAAKVKADAEAAKRYADEAKKAVADSQAFSDGMKSDMSSYWPNPNAEPKSALTEARVIELIDQRFKELQIGIRNVKTGEVTMKKVAVRYNGNIESFDIPEGGRLESFYDPNTGKTVKVRPQIVNVPNAPAPVMVQPTSVGEIRWFDNGPGVASQGAFKSCQIINGKRVCSP